MKATLGAGVGLLLAGCGSVSHRLDPDVPQPTTVAVLPFTGPATPELRDAARQLLQSRLVQRGYRAPELAFVDRVLSERGWLRDPDHFTLPAAALREVLAALQVEAVLVGEELDESSFNVFLLRRHAVGGRLALRDAAGRASWSCDHGVSTFGGFLLTSGQVFAELRAQGEHGTPMASLALVDEFVQDVVGTIPLRTTAPAVAPPPRLGATEVGLADAADGQRRIVVTTTVDGAATLRFDLPPLAHGIPMVAIPGDPRRHRGQLDVPAGNQLPRVVVHARDAFGREVVAEAGR